MAENETVIPGDSSSATEKIAAGAEPEPEQGSSGEGEGGTPLGIPQILERLGRIEQQQRWSTRVNDRRGTELGEIRRMLRELPGSIRAAPPRNLDAEREELQNDPRGFIEKILHAQGDSVSAERPERDRQAMEEDLRARMIEDERAFRNDYPDWRRHEAVMAELLERDENRVYDREGNLNPYASFERAHDKALRIARERGTAEGDSIRSRTRSEQEAAKGGASITGVSASGTERAALKGLDPKTLRGKSVKELTALARSMGMVPGNDPPRG